MTREEAINVLEQRCGYTRLQYATALRVAIDALRAQQPPLDRSRWEGCNYCNKYGIVLAAFDGWSYCNRCGRPLTEYAWAELERRINGGTTN